MYYWYSSQREPVQYSVLSTLTHTYCAARQAQRPAASSLVRTSRPVRRVALLLLRLHTPRVLFDQAREQKVSDHQESLVCLTHEAHAVGEDADDRSPPQHIGLNCRMPWHALAFPTPFSQ